MARGTRHYHASRLAVAPWRVLLRRFAVAMLALALAAAPVDAAPKKSSKSSAKSPSKSSAKSPSKPAAKKSSSSKPSSKKASPSKASSSKKKKSSTPAAKPAPKPRAATRVSGLPDTIDEWIGTIRDAEARYGEDWSVHVRDLETGNVILDYGGSRRLVPASTRKLSVFALAIEAFGPEHRFKTQLGLTKNSGVRDGALTASVVLRSAGDPTMNERFLKQKNPATLVREWIRELGKRGVQRIQGDFIIDASAFGADQDRHPEAWGTDHIGRSYATYPSAIALNDNLLQITVNPSSSGKAGKISIYPSIEGLNVVNQTRSVSGRSAGISAEFSEDGKTLTIGGRLGASIRAHGLHLPLVRPLAMIAAIVKDELNSQRILLGGHIKLVTDPAEAKRFVVAQILGEHESPPLSELLHIMMRDSDNFFAEQLWRAAAYRAKGRGDAAAARQYEQEWLRARKIGWIEPGYDGSGLSRKDHIAGAELAALVEALHRSPYRSLLMQCLPSSGRSGTLRGRSFSSGAGRVVAKTGTLNGVGALAGFILDAHGNARCAFGMIGNAPGGTKGRLNMRQNQILNILLKALDSGQITGDSGQSMSGGAAAGESAATSARAAQGAARGES